MTVSKPASLKKGGKIGVIAPAGCVDDASLTAGVEAVKRAGFEVELSPGVRHTKGYLAGEEKRRAEDLHEFFLRPDIDAILCARGGFGSIQLLPLLDRQTFERHPKIFVGYSDISVLLNWLFQECGLVTFHGPMVAMDMARGLTGASEDHFWGTLLGEKKTWEIEVAEVVSPGNAEAEMIGGCLSVLVTTLGTPFEIDPTGRLLFLEDIGEKPYRIERMLTHLKMAGKLDKPSGVVFGNFTQCEGEGPRGLRQILADIFHGAPYPVVTGIAAGHGEKNLLLPFGVKMALDTGRAALSLLEPAVR